MDPELQPGPYVLGMAAKSVQLEKCGTSARREIRWVMIDLARVDNMAGHRPFAASIKTTTSMLEAMTMVVTAFQACTIGQLCPTSATDKAPRDILTSNGAGIFIDQLRVMAARMSLMPTVFASQLAALTRRLVEDSATMVLEDAVGESVLLARNMLTYHEALSSTLELAGLDASGALTPPKKPPKNPDKKRKQKEAAAAKKAKAKKTEVRAASPPARPCSAHYAPPTTTG